MEYDRKRARRRAKYLVHQMVTNITCIEIETPHDSPIYPTVKKRVRDMFDATFELAEIVDSMIQMVDEYIKEYVDH